MTYDQWKTDPDWHRGAWYRGVCYEEDEPGPDDDECQHPYYRQRIRLWTGNTVCGCCDEVTAIGASWSERWRDNWWRIKGWPGSAWRWLRRELPRQLRRPFRAVQSWRRGQRKAPWKIDDELPF